MSEYLQELKLEFRKGVRGLRRFLRATLKKNVKKYVKRHRGNPTVSQGWVPPDVP